MKRITKNDLAVHLYNVPRSVQRFGDTKAALQIGLAQVQFKEESGGVATGVCGGISEKGDRAKEQG